MQHPFKLFLLGLFFFSMQACGAASNSKHDVLSAEERRLCDSLQIDSNVLVALRQYNTSRLEPFHYSLSKIVMGDSMIDADPIHLQGLVFAEENEKTYTLILNLKEKLNQMGYSIFLLERNFNIGNKPDQMAILKTTDKYTILKQIGTDAVNYDITNDSLLSIIHQFDQKYDLELIAASGDACEFIIRKEPADWLKFAEEVYKVCPDVVDQGSGDTEALAKEMKKSGKLYFWWD